MTSNLHTKHSETRMAQRAISETDVETLLNWGDYSHQRGAEIYFGSKKAIEALVSEGVSPKDAERIKNKYLVIKNRSILTVAHKYN
jgi:hypothetical protein